MSENPRSIKNILHLHHLGLRDFGRAICRDGLQSFRSCRRSHGYPVQSAGFLECVLLLESIVEDTMLEQSWLFLCPFQTTLLGFLVEYAFMSQFGRQGINTM